MKTRTLIPMLCVVLGATPCTLAQPSRLKSSPADYEARRKVQVDEYFKNLAKYGGKMPPLKFGAGLGHLWLNDNLELGNRKIREADMSILSRIAKKAKIADINALTPEIIDGDKELRWKMADWIRAYYLFSDKSTQFPGRLDAENQKRIEMLMWSWLQSPRHHGFGKGSRNDPKNALVILGTENGETPRFPATLMAAQILKNHPEYKDRKLPDGGTLEEAYNGMRTFLNAKWDGMARHGLLVEAMTSYNTATLCPLYNIVDYCEDAALREKTAMLLDTIWAEWAVGSINGVRGGGKCRKYSVGNGSNDPWLYMARCFFDLGPWGEGADFKYALLASSNYRVPEVIKDIAKDHVGRGEYVYVGKRFAKVRASGRAGWDDFDPVDTRALAYDYVTPDFVMGSLLVDPTLSEGRKPGDYSPLFAQNMLISMIFATDLDARICPRGFGGKSYLQYHTAQHENVMVVQKHPRGRNVKLMQVYFSAGMKERLVEKDGWRFLQEGDAYVAVKGFSSKDGTSAAPCKWADGNHLRVEDPDAPIVFILGRKAKHGSLGAFEKYVLSSTTGLKGKQFTLKTVDAHDKPVELGLFLDGSAIPRVNGRPINFLPKRVFDSPFFWSDHDSGVIHLEKGDGKLLLDFNKAP